MTEFFQTSAGWSFEAAWFTATIIGILLIAFPVWYLPRNALSGLGVRALVLSAFWAGIVGFGGGDSLPFFQAMAPILAILFVAVQEAMQTALDSRRTAVNHARSDASLVRKLTRLGVNLARQLPRR